MNGWPQFAYGAGLAVVTTPGASVDVDAAGRAHGPGCGDDHRRAAEPAAVPVVAVVGGEVVAGEPGWPTGAKLISAQEGPPPLKRLEALPSRLLLLPSRAGGFGSPLTGYGRGHRHRTDARSVGG